MSGSYGKPSSHTRMFTRVIERDCAILWLLAEQGDISDPSGRAVAKLNAQLATLPHLKPVSMSNLTSTLARLEADNLLLRTTVSKRTYDIGLAVTAADVQNLYGPSPWPKPVAVEPEPEEEPIEDETVDDEPVLADVVDPEPELADVVPMWEAPTLPPEADPAALLSAAMVLIAQAVSVSKPALEVPMPDVLARLAEQTEESDRLRRRLAAVGDELRAIKAERDGLRKAKAMLEENLRIVAKNGKLDEAALRRFREWDGMVRSAPGSAKGA